MTLGLLLLTLYIFSGTFEDSGPFITDPCIFHGYRITFTIPYGLCKELCKRPRKCCLSVLQRAINKAINPRYKDVSRKSKGLYISWCLLKEHLVCSMSLVGALISTNSIRCPVITRCQGVWSSTRSMPRWSPSSAGEWRSASRAASYYSPESSAAGNSARNHRRTWSAWRKRRRRRRRREGRSLLPWRPTANWWTRWQTTLRRRRIGAAPWRKWKTGRRSYCGISATVWIISATTCHSLTW